MSDFWVTLLFFVGYIVLMRYVLPKAGVPTWMADSCQVPGEQIDKKDTKVERTEK